MTQPEKSRFGEQAINKIAEVALASQLKQVEKLAVQLKIDLSKLAHGEVDSISINMNGLLMQQDLIAEELQLQINRVIVKPFSAILGKIKLTQPCTGTIRVVFNEDDLTRAFNSESFRANLPQDKQVKIYLQQVNCHLLADGNIAFQSDLILTDTGQAQSVAFTTVPRIGNDGREILLQDVHYLDSEELAPELIAALLTQVGEFLSLRMFEQKGMSLKFQQLDVTAGKLTIQAAAYIEQFPSS